MKKETSRLLGYLNGLINYRTEVKTGVVQERSEDGTYVVMLHGNTVPISGVQLGIKKRPAKGSAVTIVLSEQDRNRARIIGTSMDQGGPSVTFDINP